MVFFATSYQNFKNWGAGIAKSVLRLGRLPMKLQKDKSYFSSQKYKEGILGPRSSISNGKTDSTQEIERPENYFIQNNIKWSV
jgi:hypothetical protein